MNERYNSWIIVSDKFRVPGKKGLFVKCVCDCGTESVVNYQNVVTGKSKSCGVRSNHRTKPLREDHRLYSTWKSMFSRCYNKNVWSYKYYGGKGVTVCDEWRDFEKFVDDMYPLFKEGLTLDRKDSSGNYCKENCRWATKSEQAANQDKSLKLYYEGKYYTEAELARTFGVKRTTVQRRRNNGYTVEEMIYGRNNTRSL